MSSEKEALLFRLQQMEEKERFFLKELQKERNEIYDRLREIDSQPSLSSLAAFKEPVKVREEAAVAVETGVLEDEAPTAVPGKKEVVESLPSSSSSSAAAAPRPKVSNVQAVRDVLKDSSKSLTISEIRRELDRQYGLSPANLTTILYKLKKETDAITSPGRGVYFYQEPVNAEGEELQEEE
ncbi:hypothetical protein GA0061096_3607 [Fictibacillus enclensis]|uniref:Uncharacterized protein n=1 Tax=Fictibacillus enclensis TaxID=1017270 RepID=A0A0V8J4Y6_9BACL|nr:hypothetical protein [Fictibacillus enclensis]KSU82010.1 hypothetical protein AS030_17170 [Fictibacillus enclensis]SCC28971.1 hypothetical protein GA0061096_3607 [Fictibacillus enclensis]